MIQKVQKQLEQLLADHGETVGLLLSGGSDSVLLLRILLDMNAKFRCLTFDHSFSREQRVVIDDIVERFGVRVFSYRPSDTYLISSGKSRVSMVEEYQTSGKVTFPFIRDCKQDDSQCIHDELFGAERNAVPPIGFSLYLSGTRRFDTHRVTGRAWKRQTWVARNKIYHAPLWNLTRKDVVKALAVFDEPVPTLDTGILGLCVKCLTATAPVKCPRSGDMIEPHVWSPADTVKAFRRRFRIQEPQPV